MKEVRTMANKQLEKLKYMLEKSETGYLILEAFQMRKPKGTMKNWLLVGVKKSAIEVKLNHQSEKKVVNTNNIAWLWANNVRFTFAN